MKDYMCVLRVLGMMLAVMLFAALGAVAADSTGQTDVAAKKPVLSIDARPREARTYDIKVDVEGAMPSADGEEAIELDTQYSLRVMQRYGRREGDGLLPMEMSVIDGKVVASGQELTVSPGLFPKLTVLLDRDWRISQMFGFAGTGYAKSSPGINYGNLITLFFPQSADQPHALGDVWETKVKLPIYNETYLFKNEFKSTDVVNGVLSAVLEQNLSWQSPVGNSGRQADVKAVVQSSFALNDGKLVKSHADCEVIFRSGDNDASSQQDPAVDTANIKIDISLVK